MLEKALSLTSETDDVEFKGNAALDTRGDWCEFLKDVFAVVNSGGEIIVFGLDSRGRPTGLSDSVKNLDPAHVADKIYAYTSQNYSALKIVQGKKAGSPVVGLEMGTPEMPLVPSKAGTYEDPHRKPKCAFREGTLYVRHTGKSVPATSDDVRRIIEREREMVRQELLAGVTKVFEAPEGSRIEVVSADEEEQDEGPGSATRLVASDDAEHAAVLNPNKTHPYRMMHLLDEVNARLPADVKKINQHDIRVALYVFGLQDDIAYMYEPDYGPKKYTQAFADFLVDKIDDNRHALQLARSQYRRMKGEQGAQ